MYTFNVCPKSEYIIREIWDIDGIGERLSGTTRVVVVPVIATLAAQFDVPASTFCFTCSRPAMCVSAPTANTPLKHTTKHTLNNNTLQNT